MTYFLMWMLSVCGVTDVSVCDLGLQEASVASTCPAPPPPPEDDGKLHRSAPRHISNGF